MNQPIPWLPALFVAFFAVLWVGVLNLIAHLGGWSRLAAAYRCLEPFKGYRKRFVSGSLLGGGLFGFPCDYNGCLTIGASAAGLYLAVLPPFRPGHPPIFVPWRDVTARVEKRWLWMFTVFSFEQVPDIRLRMLHRWARRIVEEGGAAVTASLNPTDDQSHATRL